MSERPGRAKARAASDPRLVPVFVGGAGRSGTTLLRVMLDAHPALAAGPEFKFVPDLVRAYNLIRAESGVSAAFGLGGGHLEAVFGEAILRLFDPFREAHGGRRLVEKTPHNVLVMKELGRMLPGARFIHIARDGRDVASSLVTMDWYGADGRRVWYVESLEAAYRYWTMVVSQAMADARTPGLAGRVYEIRYEDLVRGPEPALRGVLEFLGEPWSDTVLRHHEGERRAEPVESSTAQVRRPVHQGSVGRWRESATDSDRRMFKELGGKLLVRLGYEQGDDW